MAVIDFDPMVPLFWLILIVVLAIVFFGWREAQLSYRFRWLRVLAQAVSILAIAGLILRPSYQRQANKPGLVLLTSNYSAGSLDSLLLSSPQLTVLGAPGVAPRAGTVAIKSYREMSKLGDLQFVLGDGLPLASLDDFRKDGFVYLPGPLPKGIVQLTTGPFPENRRNWIRGSVFDMKRATLTLIGSGGAEDSVNVERDGRVDFSLAFTTKRPGRYVYALSVRDSLGLTLSHAVPIDVASSPKLSILLLQTYPQAEVRFLKNYVASKGHFLVTRYQLSKGVFRYEFANGTTKKFSTLNADVLNDFDLVVTDEESLRRMTTSDNHELELAVSRGLGLLMLLQQAPDTKHFPGNDLDLSPDREAPDTIRYTVPGFGTFVSPFTGVRSRPGGKIQPVLIAGNKILSGFVLKSQGKIAFQSLRETYRLSLSGDSESYAALWTYLLEQVARRGDARLAVRAATRFPVYPDEPIDVELLGTEPGDFVTAQGSRIPLTEDVRVDDLWHGRFWAGEPGWAWCSSSDDSVRLNVFVSKPGEWPSIRISNQRLGNMRVGVTEPVPLTWTVRKSISPLIFFVAFLLGAGFVWLAPKL